MKIGLLCGREYSFPPAFIARGESNSGKTEGIAAEFVKLGGTRMGEPAEYRVIVDRISHEVEYYRGYLEARRAARAPTSSTILFGGPPMTNFSITPRCKARDRNSKDRLTAPKRLSSDVDINSESLRNLNYPVDWDGLLDYVGRPAILKPYSGRRLEARLQSE